VGSRERACAVIEDLFEEVWRDRARWKTAVEVPAVDWISRCRELALAQTGPDPRRPDPRHPDSTHPDPRRPMTDPIASAAVLTPAPSAAAEGALSDPRLVAREALASLPETDRRALEEAYFRGAHAREVAVLIGAATSDAAMILRSALVRFREHVAERGQVAEREAAAAATGGAS
jgi:DNA-directed RNA polymerase specialized sigma24 family protein